MLLILNIANWAICALESQNDAYAYTQYSVTYIHVSLYDNIAELSTLHPLRATNM